MARQLTDKQKKFLAVLFDEANGSITVAKRLAGYSDNTTNHEIITSLKDEIMSATQDYMASNAPQAAVAMVSGIIDPTQLGLKERMIAAKELLDRTGLVKTEKVQVETNGGVMILPPKNSE